MQQDGCRCWALHSCPAPLLLVWALISELVTPLSPQKMLYLGPKYVKWGVTVRTDLEQSRKFNFPVSFSSSSFGRKGLLSAPGIKTFFFLKQTGHAVSVGQSSCRVRRSKEVGKTIFKQDTGLCRSHNVPDSSGVRPVTCHPSTC